MPFVKPQYNKYTHLIKKLSERHPKLFRDIQKHYRSKATKIANRESILAEEAQRDNNYKKERKHLEKANFFAKIAKGGLSWDILRSLFLDSRLSSSSEKLIEDLYTKAETGNNGRKVVIIFPIRGQYLKYLFFRGIASYLKVRFGFEIKLRPLLTDSRWDVRKNKLPDVLWHRLVKQLEPYRGDDWEVIILDSYGVGNTERQIKKALRPEEGQSEGFLESIFSIFRRKKVISDFYYTSNDYSYKLNPVQDIEIPILPPKYYPRKYFTNEKGGIQALEFAEEHKKELKEIRRAMLWLGYRYMQERFEKNKI